jgi:diguanylate cyclase (GGDEF)-like protein/PAS domain S-box-containing protein
MDAGFHDTPCNVGLPFRADPTSFYQTLLDGVRDGVYFVDRSLRILFWNKGAEALTGYRRTEVTGRSCRDTFTGHCPGSPLQPCGEDCPLVASLKDGLDREFDSLLLHKDGTWAPVTVRVLPLRDDSGEIAGAVQIFSDKSKSALEQARRSAEMALLDPLTGICNRRAGDQRLQQLGSQAGRFRGSILLYIDIDHFKQVNDRFGHSAGDDVLRMVAQALKHHLRPDDFVCRWGGDEFLVILSDKANGEGERVAERCRALIEAAVCEVRQGQIRVTCSIGMAEVRSHDSAMDLLARADACQYASKAYGRNRVTSHELKLRPETDDKLVDGSTTAREACARLGSAGD